MIHLLEVGPELTVKDLNKLSRRYAMTGGYELALISNLKVEELIKLIEQHLPLLKNYQQFTSAYFGSNSYRILALVYSHPRADNSIKARLEGVIRQPNQNLQSEVF